MLSPTEHIASGLVPLFTCALPLSVYHSLSPAPSLALSLALSPSLPLSPSLSPSPALSFAQRITLFTVYNRGVMNNPSQLQGSDSQCRTDGEREEGGRAGRGEADRERCLSLISVFPSSSFPPFIFLLFFILLTVFSFFQHYWSLRVTEQ